MKMISKIIAPLAAALSFLPSAAGEDFAIESPGFTSIAGTIGGGGFELTGALLASSPASASGGGFELTGELMNIAAPVPASVEELIVNGSFENTEGTFVRDANGVMSLPAGSAALPGWTVTQGEAAWVDNTNAFQAGTPFGNGFIDLTGYAGPNAALSQTIATVAGQTYRFSFALGSNSSYPGANGNKTVSVCAGSEARLFTFVPTNTVGNQWATFGFSFTATAASTEIVLFGIVPSGIYLGLDNVSVVPENTEIPSDPEELVVNGSFEMVCPVTFKPDGFGIMPLQPGATDVPGWTTANAELAWGMNENAFGPRTPFGSLFLDLTGYHDAPPYGGVTQLLSTVPGQNYTVSFAIGVDQNRGVYTGPMTVGVTAGFVSNSFTFTPSGSGSQWGRFTMNFTAASTTTPLSLVGINSTGGQYLGLDDVSVRPGGLELKISGSAQPGGALQLSFLAAPGAQYVLQASDDLSNSSWQVAPGTEGTGTGQIVRINLPNPISKRQSFYRLRVEP